MTRAPVLRYSVAVDPIRTDSASPWLVLQESTDFEGWVLVAKAKTKSEADRFVAQLEQMERLARKQAKVIAKWRKP